MVDIRLELTDAQRTQIRDLAVSLGCTNQQVLELAIKVGIGIFQAKKDQTSDE